MAKKIALVEDDPVIRQNYLELLAEEGFEVEGLADRRGALARFREVLPDLVLLDIGLEEPDAGFQLCMELRRLSPVVPIIFLTAHDSETDKISGLRLGADDYITKDITIDYLLVRIEALFRRIEARAAGHAGNRLLVRGELTLDPDRLSLSWRRQPVELTLTQWWMVHELVREPGQAKSHAKLMRAANIVVEPNTITAHVRAIRSRFRSVDPGFDCIRTEYGHGYRWVESAE